MIAFTHMSHVHRINSNKCGFPPEFVWKGKTSPESCSPSNAFDDSKPLCKSCYPCFFNYHPPSFGEGNEGGEAISLRI